MDPATQINADPQPWIFDIFSGQGVQKKYTYIKSSVVGLESARERAWQICNIFLSCGSWMFIPDSYSFSIPDLESQIQKQQKEEGEKIVVLPFL